VANRNPSPATRYKPGQSGNPGGGSRKQRIADALSKMIEEKQLEGELALTVYVMATGQHDKLKGRTPDLSWFNRLCQLLGEDKAPPDFHSEAAGHQSDTQTLRDHLAAAKASRAKAKAPARGRGNTRKPR